MKVSITAKSDNTIAGRATEPGSLYQEKDGTLLLRLEEEDEYVSLNNRSNFAVETRDSDDRFIYIGELKFD